MDEDPWIKNHSPIAPEKLHALGYITLVWNSCENGLFGLLSTVSGLSEGVCRAFVYDLGDVTISNRIEAFLEMRKVEAEPAKAIRHALNVYDVCRQNRNALTHAGLAAAGGHGLSLSRVRKKPAFISDLLPDDLEDFRRVAEEIRALNRHLKELWFILPPYNDPIPSPDTLPVPCKLVTPPQPTRTKRQRQPQS